MRYIVVPAAGWPGWDDYIGKPYIWVVVIVLITTGAGLVPADLGTDLLRLLILGGTGR
jgi:hypothetical protein